MTIFNHPSFAGDNTFQHPFYIGGTAGYGSTTWDGLVPTTKNQNMALSLSTPIETEEGGGVVGFFLGYEFFPYFAVEGAYAHYHDATVRFDPISLFSFDNDERVKFVTHTETISLMGKFMILVPHTMIKIYSSAGIASLHREDILMDSWRITPTFGVGLNYNFTPHIMGELGGNYTAGFGESALNPSESYFPFLYSAFVRLAYRV